jgi:hypothetical protein
MREPLLVLDATSSTMFSGRLAVSVWRGLHHGLPCA